MGANPRCPYDDHPLTREGLCPVCGFDAAKAATAKRSPNA